MKSRLIAFWVLLTAVFFLHTNALPSDPPSKGRRLIGHGITEGAIEFGQALALAREAGLEFIELPLAWNSIETAPARYHSKILTIAQPPAVSDQTKKPGPTGYPISFLINLAASSR